MEKTLPTNYQQYIHISRYSRWIEELGRRETWEETITRLIEFWKGRIEDKVKDSEFKEIENAILNLNIMPSMRSLMTAGPALDRDEVAGYNCSFTVIDHPRCFDEIMYVLMCGTGMGFSVERQFVTKLPEIAEEFHESHTTIVVSDSKLGWASSLRELISLLYSGKIPKWDLSKIRPAGARLKTFGGRASGPKPMEDLFKFCVEIFKKAKGRKLTSIECHDLVCKIAEIVVVGGVRRSALLSLSNLSDDRMRNAKSGQWWIDHPHRALANNSYVADEKPSFQVFLDEWLSLYESKCGERGIFSLEAARKKSEENGRRDGSLVVGSNPCNEILLRDKQMCVSADTKLITKNGIREISEIADQKHNIWNGEKWSEVTVRKTGSNQKLVRVHLGDGSYLDCTPDHRFSVKNRFQKNYSEVQAKDLMSFSKYTIHAEPHNIVPNEDGENLPFDMYTAGFAVGDGCVYKNRALIDLHGEDMNCPVQGNRYIKTKKKNHNVDSQRVFSSEQDAQFIREMKTDVDAIYNLAKVNRRQILEFFAGWIDADGSNTASGNSVRLYLSNEERARAAQLVLTRCGIKSSVNMTQKKRTKTNFGIRNDDLWYLQIADCADIPCHRVRTNTTKVARFKGKNQTIVNVEELDGVHDTFCFNEPERHMGLFGNLLTYQCNLSEVVIRPNDTLDTLKEKVRLATILGTFQSTLTDFRYLRKKWKSNCEEERLLGVSLTGISDHPVLREPSDKTEEWLNALREETIKTNKEWAKKLKINQSTAITCVKPSGTVSQLTDSASGIHPRYSQYYVRRVRNDKKDPLSQFMIDKGFPYEDDVMNSESYVFSFPMKSPETATVAANMSAMGQLKLWKMYATAWCEHKPSMTAYYEDNNFLEVGNWIWNNFDIVSGVSFLPHSDHTYQQAPYEEITEEKYSELAQEMPEKVDWTELEQYELQDTTTSTQEYACGGAAGCEI